MPSLGHWHREERHARDHDGLANPRSGADRLATALAEVRQEGGSETSDDSAHDIIVETQLKELRMDDQIAQVWSVLAAPDAGRG